MVNFQKYLWISWEKFKTIDKNLNVSGHLVEWHLVDRHLVEWLLVGGHLVERYLVQTAVNRVLWMIMDKID